MNSGKLPESILKRSVIKKTGTMRGEVILGAMAGGDCAVLKGENGFDTAVSTETTIGTNAALTVIKAANNLAAAGAETVGIEVSLTLPADTEEAGIKAITDETDRECRELGIQVIGGHSCVTGAVTKPVISVTAVGRRPAGSGVFANGARSGDDVVLTKWIGIEGTYLLAVNMEEELKKKFPSKMIYDAKNFAGYLSVASEAAPAVKSGVSAMHNLSAGGVFSALWELGECSGVGLEIELRKIPVKQETIEICNYFDINPYELASEGSMLMTAPDGNGLVLELKKAGIEAAVIGKCTDSNDRVVLNGDIRRFLEPAKSDEITKVLA